MDVLDQELGIRREVCLVLRQILGLLGVHGDLGEKVEVLHVRLLVDLGDFEVVNLLDHLLELGHDFKSLTLLGDSSLVEHAHDWLGDHTRAELEVRPFGGGLAFEDDADQELHAQPDDGLLIAAVDLDGVGQLNNFLQETRLDEGVHDVLVGDFVELGFVRVGVSVRIVIQGNLDHELQQSVEGEVSGLLRHNPVLLSLTLLLGLQVGIGHNLVRDWLVGRSVPVVDDLEEGLEIASDGELVHDVLRIDAKQRIFSLQDRERHRCKSSGAQLYLL